MDDDRLPGGLDFARSLKYTDAQYEEALRRIDSPDMNKLLPALIDVKSCGQFSQTSGSSTDTIGSSYSISQTGSTSAHETTTQDDKKSFSSSCFSSITSISSSSPSNQSLQESSTQQQQQQKQQQQQPKLRKIYIDGSNVAKTYGNGEFSWVGIKLCVEWFLALQHPVKVIVPEDKCALADTATLQYLEGIVETTPTGCNDDWFVIKAARINNAVIVSNDHFRDEKRFNVELQRFIQCNRLPYAFIDHLFIPAEDPCGSFGPTLNEFLKDSPFVYSNYHQQYQYHKKLHRTKSQTNQRNGYSERGCPSDNIYDNISRHNFRQHNQLSRSSSAAYSTDRDLESHYPNPPGTTTRPKRTLCRMANSHNL